MKAALCILALAYAAGQLVGGCCYQRVDKKTGFRRK